MRYLLICAAVLLAGCAGHYGRAAARDAEEEYRIVAQTGSLREKCAAAERAKAAWLRARDEHKYNEWAIRAGSHCIDVLLEDLQGGGAENLVR